MKDKRTPGGMRLHNPWPRFHEPLKRTLVRNLAIAVVVGAALALWKHDAKLWLPFSVLALWFSLGGHFVEVLFLNGLRSSIPTARPIQMGARLTTWFAGGAILYLCMATTAHALPVRPPPLGLWWLGGLFLVAVELLAHLILALRSSSSFYNSGNQRLQTAKQMQD